VAISPAPDPCYEELRRRDGVREVVRLLTCHFSHLSINEIGPLFVEGCAEFPADTSDKLRARVGQGKGIPGGIGKIVRDDLNELVAKEILGTITLPIWKPVVTELADHPLYRWRHELKAYAEDIRRHDLFSGALSATDLRPMAERATRRLSPGSDCQPCRLFLATSGWLERIDRDADAEDQANTDHRSPLYLMTVPTPVDLTRLDGGVHSGRALLE
jgi:hypothetical protein